MPSVHEVTKPLTGLCSPVPGLGPGVCVICRGCRRPDFSTCYSCARVTGQVRRPCHRVIPLSLYTIPSGLHATLRRYKDGETGDQRRQHAALVVSLLARFLFDHGDCLRNCRAGGWDVITTVPSTDRPGPHPLQGALALVPWLAAQHQETLVRGTGSMSHNVASDHGFAALRDVRGSRVLVVDDTFTTGARAQSASSALQLAGARVTAIVPIGRVIDPTCSEHSRAYWTSRSRQAFDFGRCCLED
jgi:adenine/guanine phosphoribosyltransferase-like PRPP-binding protein